MEKAYWIDVNDNPVKCTTSLAPVKDDSLVNVLIPLDSCWCSNCGAWLCHSDGDAVYGNYCPVCGAEMTGR